MWLRRQDWPERLAELVEARRHAPFVWGVHDCAMFAADAVEAMVCEDPLAAWRGAYSTEAEGDALTEAAGGFEAFMVEAFRAFGAPCCPPVLAQRGDPGLVRYGNAVSLGISLGHCVVVPGLTGLSFLAPRMMFRAWAV